MRFSSFFSLVEIRTKVASMIPFAMGTIYAIFRFGSFNWRNCLYMLISLLAFDMVTTAINNYYDFKKAQKKQGYNYEVHNAIVYYGLSERTVLAIIFTLVTIAVLAGLMLFWHTNLVVLLLGGLSFMVGILYSFGPIPISRLPLGEIFSGLFMGFVIIFVASYIHVYDQSLVTLTLENGVLNLRVDLLEVILLFFIALPVVNGIANIMLANNTCDIEDDLQNRRYTLPVFIGREKALQVFRALYYIAYLDVIFLVMVKVLPVMFVLFLLTFVPVGKNLRIFMEKQTKKDTFVVSVKNFVLMNLTYLLLFGLAVVLS